MTNVLFETSRARGTGHKIGQINPLQRYGIPEEVAQVTLFLASDESSYINGSSIVGEFCLTDESHDGSDEFDFS
jgi:NAD(P)-dependent dehydrogenase (short-subunit alcohol dehydrogenase family)